MIPQEIRDLSTPDKLQLVQELWADIVTHQKDLVLTPEQELELDRRFLVHDADPLSGIPWEQARQKLRPQP